MKQRIIILGLVLVVSVVLGGCMPQTDPQTTDINMSLTGTLTQGPGETFLLMTEEGIKELHNGSANLVRYLGKNVTVTGQYSGTTLYVDKIE